MNYFEFILCLWCFFPAFLGSYTTRATAAAAADGGVNQNLCYDAVLNALFLSVYLQLPDSWNVGRGRGLFNNALNCKDYVILVLGEWMNRENWCNYMKRGRWSIGGNLNHFLLQTLMSVKIWWDDYIRTILWP
jgi:hypothetical protein